MFLDNMRGVNTENRCIVSSHYSLVLQSARQVWLMHIWPVYTSSCFSESIAKMDVYAVLKLALLSENVVTVDIFLVKFSWTVQTAIFVDLGWKLLRTMLVVRP